MGGEAMWKPLEPSQPKEVKYQSNTASLRDQRD